MEMISKDITMSTDARMKLKSGVDKLANAVKVTLGPLGRNVVIENAMAPHVTKDGVTVARSIFFKDKIENIAAQILKQAADKTASVVGDGTTTSTVLAQSMINLGLKNIIAGSSPIGIKRGIDKTAAKLVELVQSKSLKLNNNVERIKQVATISANNDTKIGSMIADAIAEVGNEGVVIAQEGKSLDSYVDYMMGMQYNHGYLSPYFINNNNTLSCEFDNPYIFIYDGVLSNINELIPVLEKTSSSGKPLLIIADDVVGQALGLLVVNVVRAGMKVCATKAPGFGLQRKDLLLDIAAVIDAKIVNKETLEEFQINHLGSAKRVVVKKGETSIIDGSGIESDIEERINIIKQQIADEKSDYEKEKLQRRLSKLTSGAAIIHVGAATEIELKEKKDRIDDAIYATKAAIESGYLPGGGASLIHLYEEIDNFIISLADDELIGGIVFKESLKAPLNAICENAGQNGEFVIQTLLKENNFNIGWNAKTGEFTDLINAGVIDPTKVVVSAIQNATSVTGMILSTECVISNDPDSESEKMSM